jgi:hypothetical protein
MKGFRRMTGSALDRYEVRGGVPPLNNLACLSVCLSPGTLHIPFLVGCPAPCVGVYLPFSQEAQLARVWGGGRGACGRLVAPGLAERRVTLPPWGASAGGYSEAQSGAAPWLGRRGASACCVHPWGIGMARFVAVRCAALLAAGRHGPPRVQQRLLLWRAGPKPGGDAAHNLHPRRRRCMRALVGAAATAVGPPCLHRRQGRFKGAARLMRMRGTPSLRRVGNAGAGASSCVVSPPLPVVESPVLPRAWRPRNPNSIWVLAPRESRRSCDRSPRRFPKIPKEF